ncbi:MAG: UDP-N-acetylglucosamine--N-acetylmuramyl-(pentapeptide) pyrophosphoryl-undecaprenol N-acetylglucosamine transferase [Candidatus Paceibacterota bacterium]|jgi:UDP-N-acetylglucosamine--N-acetylmuramyl-(pentapeptide) pyrophosphoryl-undecaprenol N-acetylglucosamine transferase
MKILFTGGGTGGHFYPLIAISEKVNEIIDREKILSLKLYYMSDSPYDKEALFQNSITYIPVVAGKMRTYFSLLNIIDIFKTIIGVITGFITVFLIFPDIIVSKGGYASFPVLVAAKILRIPVIVHESDSTPGRVNKWAGKFAVRVAISYKEVAQYFPEKTTAFTGQPIREEILQPAKTGMVEFFKLEEGTPTIVIIGGSQGAEVINNAIIDALPELLNTYQIIHQTGQKNIDSVKERAEVVISNHKYKDRYHPMPYFNVLATKMAAGAATLIISRAGSAIFEFAAWGVPSIIIPITNSNGDHQRKNAFNYARAGACSVIEEINLTPHVLSLEVNRIIGDPKKLAEMRKNALAFATPNAAETIAREAVDIALSHEK